MWNWANENGCVCAKMSQSVSERELVWAGLSGMQVGCKWNERKCDKSLMLDINLKFIVVSIFLLPVRAALHHGGLYILWDTKTFKMHYMGHISVHPAFFRILTLNFSKNLKDWIKNPLKIVFANLYVLLTLSTNISTYIGFENFIRKH